MACLTVATVPNAGHQVLTLEPTTHPVVNSLGLSPAFLQMAETNSVLTQQHCVTSPFYHYVVCPKQFKKMINNNNVMISKYLSRTFIQMASPTGFFLSYQDQLVFLFSSNLSLTVKGKNKVGKSTPLEVPGLPHFPRENYKSLRPRFTAVTALWNHIESVKTKKILLLDKTHMDLVDGM